MFAQTIPRLRYNVVETFALWQAIICRPRALQTLFGIDIDDPSNYNLVLNVFALPLESSAELLASFAREVDRAATTEQWNRMRDAALSAEVRAGGPLKWIRWSTGACTRFRKRRAQWVFVPQ